MRGGEGLAVTRPWDAEITESGSGPYLRLLGIEILEADEGRALLRMPWADPLDTFRINHVMHGGAIASLIGRERFTSAAIGTASGWSPAVGMQVAF